MNGLVFKLKTLTPIWTGGVDGKPDKLHITGIRGSIRWWYEALIRGLGGYACDPTDDSLEFKRCELKLTDKEKKERELLNKKVKQKICPACYLFGCTGWSGKFILRITEPDKMTNLVSLNSRDILFDLHFIEKKAFEEAEKNLLKMILKLIVNYGAIGGKTTQKPSEEIVKNTEQYTDKNRRIKKHHFDYGLIAFLSDKPSSDTDCKTVLAYINQNKVNLEKKNNKDWPDLKYFWFIKDCCIDRETHNKIICRNNTPTPYSKGKFDGCYIDDPSEMQAFWGGYGDEDKKYFSPCLLNEIQRRGIEKTQNESKKIFSFHGIDPKDCNKEIPGIKRCFGYGRSQEERDDVKKMIEAQLNEKKSECIIKTGEEVLNEL